MPKDRPENNVVTLIPYTAEIFLKTIHRNISKNAPTEKPLALWKTGNRLIMLITDHTACLSSHSKERFINEAITFQ